MDEVQEADLGYSTLSVSTRLLGKENDLAAPRFSVSFVYFQGQTCASLWKSHHQSTTSHKNYIDGCVKPTARGPKLAHQRFQSGPQDGFVKCKNYI